MSKMLLLLEWGKEIYLSYVCVAETVFLTLLLSLLLSTLYCGGGGASKLPSDGNFFWLLLV